MGGYTLLRHIVTWNYKDEFTDNENKENARKVKSMLEDLPKHISEIIELNVYINELSSSNKDIILNSLFKNENTLAAYKVHPEHQKASVYISSVLQNRACIDYFE